MYGNLKTHMSSYQMTQMCQILLRLLLHIMDAKNQLDPLLTGMLLQCMQVGTNIIQSVLR